MLVSREGKRIWFPWSLKTVMSGKITNNIGWIFIPLEEFKACGAHWRHWIWTSLGPDSSSYFWFCFCGLQINFARPVEREE